MVIHNFDTTIINLHFVQSNIGIYFTVQNYARAPANHEDIMEDKRLNLGVCTAASSYIILLGRLYVEHGTLAADSRIISKNEGAICI